MEIILTVQQRLELKYGDAWRQVDQAMTDLRQAHRASGIDSEVVYADDARSLEPFGLEPIQQVTPEEIKNLIDRLEGVLAAREQPLEAVLLVGGDEIVPFHRQSDPTGDDPDIPTDNPYASTDDEPLVVERSLGRMPDAAEGQPGFLVQLLRHAADLHRRRSRHREAFGFSAERWERPSEQVYAEIPQRQRLRLSPPVLERHFVGSWVDRSRACYFNLHGAEHTDAWYGERRGGSPDLPVALRAHQLRSPDLEAAILFSEACYGGNILGKRPQDAICLSALERKAACFVGSTKTAYGAVEPPPADADLLGLLFFRYVRPNVSTGQAFLLAKQEFARQALSENMSDPTAQKTILEFVLYGDPSLRT
ncbi:MAG: hypothetical protein HYY26_01330 [Acidobacteria bacterium]|nr:hypothetical protein [Acidobacteriota bacterium]